MIQRDAQTYGYDSQGRLALISGPGGSATMQYDGYAEDVTITDGKLTIAVGSGAVDPKICFVEIAYSANIHHTRFHLLAA